MEKSIHKIFILPFLAVIKFYRIIISPWLPFSCRYQPTCSEYAQEAFNRYGVIKGFYLALRRMMRCHPWGGSGYNPVPLTEKHIKLGSKRALGENSPDDSKNGSQKNLCCGLD